MRDRSTGKFIGVVDDVFDGVSRNGNKYIKLILSDEHGKFAAMMCDNSRGDKYTEYLDAGNKKPNKGDIVFCFGSKSSDIVFAEQFNILNEKIYMKLSDLN